MSDVAEAEYGWQRDETGLVLVFTGWDEFRGRLPRAAARVDGTLRESGRYAALFGHRLLTIRSPRNLSESAATGS